MPPTSDEVNARKFQPTKSREGYDQAEVDDFLDEVAAELRRLHKDNHELREQLAVCEKRAAELSRAAAGSAPKQRSRATVAALSADGDDKARDAIAVPAEPAAKHETSPPAPIPAASSPSSSSSEPTSAVQEAAGMLTLAQRLHDEHVRTGERERDRLVAEAKAHADRLLSEAEKDKRDILSALEQERSGLEHLIDKLKQLEQGYRSQLKSYLETQLRDLDAQWSPLPGTPPHESAASDG